MLRRPILALNFKAYPNSFGVRAVQIAKLAEKASRNHDLTVIVAPPITEIRFVASQVEIPVFAQHVDPIDPGAWTGHVAAEMVKEAGASGILINHSEKRLRIDEINFIINKAKNLKLTSLACADTPEASVAISTLNPDMLAIEPPELIGTGIAVSRAKPEVITSSVERIRKVNSEVIILTGAGISTAEDVIAAIKLGTSGVLVASAVMKAKEPEKIIKSMAEAMVKTYK